MKKKIIIISIVIYSLALLYFVTMFYKAHRSIEFFNSILNNYAPPQLAYATNMETPAIEAPDTKSPLIAAQISDWNTFLTRNPTNLELSNALIALAQKHDLKIVSLSAKGEKKQTVIKGSYELHSFNISVVGSRQDLTDLLGDLQSFGPGLVVIDSVNLSEKKIVSQADISITVYSRETRVKIDLPEAAPAKEINPSTNIRKVAGKQQT